MPRGERKVKDVGRLVRKYKEKQQARRRKRIILLPFRIITGILVLIGGVYIVFQIYFAVNSPMETSTALNATVDDGFSTVGYFIRAESLITAPHDGILEYTVDEGGKISKDEAFASVYADRAAVELNQKIKALGLRIDTLEASLSYTSNASGTEQLASSISEQILTLAELSDTYSFTRLTTPATSLKKLIVNRDFAFTNEDSAKSLISSLKDQKAELQKGISAREKQLYTQKSGYFSSNVDGYETLLTVSGIRKLTPESLDALKGTAPPADGDIVGKVVTDFDWYFAAVLSKEEASKLTVNSTVYLQFDATGDLRFKATVYSIGSRTADETVVSFRSSQNLDKLLSLRRQAATVILKTYEGLKVPREALRVDEEGNKGVYVVTGLYAEFKKIESVYETKEYYIVKTDPTNKKSLLLYDEMIISAKSLFDKKVL